MKSIFSFRYWSLLLVVPSVGFLFFLLLFPVMLAIINEFEQVTTMHFISYIKRSFDILFENNESFIGIIPFLVISTLSGVLVQGVSAIFWRFIKTKKNKADNFCKPGTVEYAKLQFFLEKNKNIASYVEWEKFLNLIYEYMALVFFINIPIYVGYGLYTKKLVHFDDHCFTSIVLLLVILFGIACFTSRVHRNAYDQAERVANDCFLEQEKSKALEEQE
jgi:hypothetical protein